MWMFGCNTGLGKGHNKIYVGSLTTNRRTMLLLCTISVCDWSNVGGSPFMYILQWLGLP